MRSYIKQDGQVKDVTNGITSKPPQLLLPIVAFCVETNLTAANYVLFMNDNTLCRAPIRTIDDNHSVMPVFYEAKYNEDGTFNGFETTPHRFGENARPTLVNINGLMTKEEREKLLGEIKNATSQTSATTEDHVPYLEGSNLSKRQQKLLYVGMVTPTPNPVSFYTYLHDELYLGKNTPEKNAILAAAITGDQSNLSEEARNEARALRFEFFAPNKIVAFSSELHKKNTEEKDPTVGDVLDFYIHCIQKELKSSGTPVIPDALQQYTAETRCVVLGTEKHDFKNDGIYNPSGLTDADDMLFRHMFLILSLQADNINLETMLTIIGREELQPFLPKLLDLIFGLITDITTRKKEYYVKDGYQVVRDSLSASFGGASLLEDRQFIPALDLALVCSLQAIPKERQHVFLTKWLKESLKVQDSDESSQLINAILTEKNVGIIVRNLKHFDELKPLVDILNLLSKAHILMQDNFNAVITYNSPQLLANVLISLNKTKIDLTSDIFNTVIAHSDLLSLTFALASLQEARITLTPDIFKTVIAHNDPLSLAFAFASLHKARITLTPDIFNAVIVHNDPEPIATALVSLQKAHITLTQDIFNAVIKHNQQKKLAMACQTINFIKENGANVPCQSGGCYYTSHLTDALKFVLTHPNPDSLATWLESDFEQRKQMPRPYLHGYLTPKLFKPYDLHPVVAYLRHVYTKNGGSEFSAWKIFSGIIDYKNAVSALQNRLAEKKNSGQSGATFKTLTEIGALPPSGAAQHSAPSTRSTGPRL